jgi:hypothetical protein
MERSPSISYHGTLAEDAGAAVAGYRGNLQKRRFLVSLLLATWIPISILIFIGLTGIAQFGLTQIKIVLLFLGGAHVQATLFFYADSEFGQIIHANKYRYIYAPLALMAGSGVLFALANPVAQAYLFLFFWAWQTYHYGRQNVGIYSFASVAESTRATRAERLALELATICGILGTIKVLGEGTVPVYLQPIVDILYLVGLYGLIGVFIFGIIVFFQNSKQSSILRGLFFFTLLAFFVPLYLSNNVLISFSSYAIAHGLQYLVFMAVVSLNSSETPTVTPWRGLLKMACLTLIFGFICYRLADLRGVEFINSHVAAGKLLDFMVGVVFGGTLAHFVIDAGAWRLRKADSREFMVKRFGFLFDQRTKGDAGAGVEG